MLVLILVGVIVTLLSHYLLYGCYGYWKKRGVPSPKPLPIVGNLGPSITVTKPLTQIYTDIYNEYKNYLYVGIYKFTQPTLLIRDVDLIKTLIIKEFPSFHDNDIVANEKVDPLFARNPFVLKGQKWKVVRSQVTAAITTGKIKNMFNLMSNVSQSLVKYLETESDGNNSIGFEAKELCAKYTTDVVATCAFGLNSNTFTDPDSEFRKMGRKIFEPTFWASLQANLLFAIPSLMNYIQMPFIPEEVQKWFIGILQETIKYREQNKITRNDYLDLVLSLKSKKGEYKFTDMDVMAHAMTFYIDGYETSAVALQFVFYEIARNQREQKRLQEEIDRILAKHNGEITYESVQEMSYLDIVISESLRLHPPAPFLLKICTKAFEMPSPKGEGTGANVPIDIDTSVIIPTYAIHHDPKLYPNPDKFIPERFTDEAKNSRPKCAYLPFGEGPRQCLGFRFALAQIKAAVVAVVSNFDISINPKTTSDFVLEPNSVLLAKQGGVWLNFHKRCN